MTTTQMVIFGVAVAGWLLVVARIIQLGKRRRRLEQPYMARLGDRWMPEQREADFCWRVLREELAAHAQQLAADREQAADVAPLMLVQGGESA